MAPGGVSFVENGPAPSPGEIGESLRKSVRAIVSRGSEKRKLKPRESIVGCVTGGLFLPFSLLPPRADEASCIISKFMALAAAVAAPGPCVSYSHSTDRERERERESFSSAPPASSVIDSFAFPVLPKLLETRGPDFEQLFPTLFFNFNFTHVSVYTALST